MNAYFNDNELVSPSPAAEHVLLSGPAPRKAVIGLLGEVLTRDLLPPAGCNRWTARRKAEVVAAVKGDLITLGEARDLYSLSIEEFVSWQRAVEHAGLAGLRATQVQCSPRRAA
jgi:Protein of unknown function (DUF1153)